MSLYERACRNALVDIYFDLATCNKLIKKHPDWDWLKDKRSEFEAKESELLRSLHEQSAEI